jgi:Spy/CpxP family protein refolding chaperone
MFRASLVVCVIGFACAAASADGPTTAPASPSAELQVAALNTLNDLDLDGDQLKAIRELLKANTDAPATEPADKGSDAYRSALKSLRDAIIADDAQKAADAEAKVDQLRSEEQLNVTTTVPLTDFARQKSDGVLKMLRSNQIGSYLGVHGDDVPDAVETILDAMDQSRGKDKTDFNATCDEASEQVGTLVAGISDGNRETDVEQQVSGLLQHAYGMTDAQYKANYKKLEVSARKIVGDLGAFTALHNWMLREMADLLANPELPAMIDARLAHPQS